MCFIVEECHHPSRRVTQIEDGARPYTYSYIPYHLMIHIIQTHTISYHTIAYCWVKVHHITSHAIISHGPMVSVDRPVFQLADRPTLLLSSTPIFLKRVLLPPTILQGVLSVISIGKSEKKVRSSRSLESSLDSALPDVAWVALKWQHAMFMCGFP